MGQCAMLSFSEAVHVSNNPASISNAEHITLSYFYTELLERSSNPGYGLVMPTNRYGVFGVSLFQLKSGELRSRDENGTETGTFTAEKNHLLLSYGQYINDKFSFGFNAKFVSESVGTYESPIQNVGIDAALSYYPHFSYTYIKNLAVGIVTDNIVKPQVKLSQTTEYLPMEVRFVAEDRFDFTNSNLTIVGNMAYLENAEYKSFFGIEYGYKLIAVLTGLYDGNPSFGGGINLFGFIANYSYASYSNTPLSKFNGFSISYQF